jgi:hypothetical protein
MRSYTLIAASILIALSTLIFGLIDLEMGKKLVMNCSYYVIFIMSGFWLFLSWPFFKTTLSGKTKAILISLFLTIMVFVSIPPKYRVLSDETNLLSVSQSMTFRRDISNVTQSKFYYGNLNVIQGDLPTRPLLFPFFTSMIHTVAGYRYQNVFVLNAIVLLALLTLTFIVVESSLGTLSAISANLLLLSIPTLTLSATSGGFDLFSLFFFALSLVTLDRFIKENSTQNFGMLLINLIMLSQIRYESIAYVTLILGTLLIFGKIKIEQFTKNPFLIAASPFFILPMLLQRKLTPNTFENPPGVPPFSIDHLIKHAGNLIDGMVNVKPDYPYPSYLNWISAILLVVMIIRISPKIKKFFTRPELLFTGLILSLVIISLMIVLSHHFGLFPHPTQARLFLVFLTFLALIPVAFRKFFPELLSERKLFAIAAVSFALYHPVATQGRFTNALTMVRETEDEYRFLNQIDDQKILIITDRPGQFTVINTGAVGFGFANANKTSLIADLNRGLVNQIWVFQKFSYDTGKPLPEQTLANEFNLIPVQEFQVTATEFIRISKVNRPFYPVQANLTQAKSPIELPKLNKEMTDMLEKIKLKPEDHR